MTGVQTCALPILADNAVNAVHARPTISGYVAVSEAVGKAVSQVLQGQGEPEEALKSAADEADAALNKK